MELRRAITLLFLICSQAVGGAACTALKWEPVSPALEFKHDSSISIPRKSQLQIDGTDAPPAEFVAERGAFAYGLQCRLEMSFMRSCNIGSVLVTV